jgi:plastocyanin
MAVLLRYSAVAAALLFGAPCMAANVTVTANADMTFTPATVTINVGDTVTFKNVGGGYHNVAADDGSFRCSDSCGNGNGDDDGGYGDYGDSDTGGGPSSTAWQFTRTFNAAGTVGYHCEVHGAAGVGMHGTIIVKQTDDDTPPPITLGGFMSGNWYDPASSGQGLQLEFTNSNNAMVAIWFTFAPDGSGPYWIYGQGTYDSTSNTVTLPAILLGGTAFPPNFNKADVQRTPWGTMTFTFTDCNNGEFSWNSDLSDYGSGSMPLTRISQIAGTACPGQ